MKLWRYLQFIVRPNAYPDRWQDRIFREHVSIGGGRDMPARVTIYGANAMHWAINVWIGGRYWCFHPTTRTFGGYWPWYFYISPDGTPQAATFIRGHRDV